MKSLGVVLVASLFLVLLVPTTEAGNPEPRPWGSHNAMSDVRAIALAREGTTIGAALRAAVTTPTAPTGVPGVPGTDTTNVARTDLAIVDYQYGFAHNATVTAPAPLGRSHVAVSRDGTAVATLGLDSQFSAQAAARLTLYYARIGAGGNWSAGSSFNKSVDLGAGTTALPIGIAVSDDGRRVAALVSEGGQSILRGYSFGGASLDNAFDLRVPGTPRALSGTGDLGTVLVAGQFTEGNFSYGGGQLYAFNQQSAMSTYLDRSTNGTDARAGAISADGKRALLVGADGRLHVFRDVAGTLANPTIFATGTPFVGNFTMSEDGTRAALTSGLALANYDLSSGTPSLLWNATLPGQNITGLSMNRTGGILVVGTSGTGGGVYAFGDSGSTPIWSLTGDTRAVAIDSEGTRVAYGQRASVGAARIPRGITFDIATGGKVAPRMTVTAPGTANVEVRLVNTGAATERIAIEESSSDVDIASPTGSFLVRPGETQIVNVTLNVLPGLTAPRVFNVSARALTSGAIDNVTVEIEPKATLDVKLHLNETDVVTEPGKPRAVILTIFNNGTGDASVTLRATQTVSAGQLWNVTAGETSAFTVLRGTRTSVQVSVTPPADAVNGTASTIQFTLEGADVFDTARVVFRINPELKVDLDAIAVLKLIEPGDKAAYSVNITNTGSLPRQFDVFYTIVEDSGRSWGVDMQSQIMRLEPTQKRTIAVNIIAPASALPGETVSILITAKSIPEAENETVVNDTISLFGRAVAPKITTTTPTGNIIPSAAPVAVVATILLVGLVLRRRSQ